MSRSESAEVALAPLARMEPACVWPTIGLSGEVNDRKIRPWPLRLMACLPGYVGVTTGVSEIAAKLLERPGCRDHTIEDQTR
jgi:hypothetical protein